MNYRLYQVDAFTNQLFRGNPAVVMILDRWLEDGLLQKIAIENNVSETAFVLENKSGIFLRWFTPWYEVDLCGHATLATAHVYFTHLRYNEPEINFHTRSGILPVRKNGSAYTMDFPVDEITKLAAPAGLFDALGIEKGEVWKGKTDYMVVLDNQAELEQLAPDYRGLSKLPVRGIIVTAKGDEVDFVSRFFAPGAGIDEDPVTGSAHTTLTPYWSNRFGKMEFVARQLSKRGGEVGCKLMDDRVELTGHAETFLIGEARA